MLSKCEIHRERKGYQIDLTKKKNIVELGATTKMIANEKKKNQ